MAKTPEKLAKCGYQHHTEWGPNNHVYCAEGMPTVHIAEGTDDFYHGIDNGWYTKLGRVPTYEEAVNAVIADLQEMCDKHQAEIDGVRQALRGLDES